MTTREKPGHAWDDFWMRLEEKGCRWGIKQDRRVFELEMEAIVGASLPEGLTALLRSYNACNWTDRPKNAICDLYDAVTGAMYCDAELHARDVLAQMHDFGTYDSGTKELIMPPAAEFPFPVERLETFLRDLKYYSFFTIWRVRENYPSLMHSLPTAVIISMEYDLLEIAMENVLDALRSRTVNSGI